LGAAVDRHFEFTEDSREFRSYPDVVRITVPKGGGTLQFQVELGVSRHGVICIRSRIQADPLSLTWLLQSLDRMMSFALSDAVEGVVGTTNREYTICVADWPAGGIALDDLIRASRMSDNYVHGNRVVRPYKLDKHDRDGWNAIRQFMAALLAEAGYVEFETDLASLTRDRLCRATMNASTVRPS